DQPNSASLTAAIITMGGSRYRPRPLESRLWQSERLHPDRSPQALPDELILRKEVIQPHLPIRLPCYDFVPLAPHTFGGWLPHLRLSQPRADCCRAPLLKQQKPPTDGREPPKGVAPPTSGADNSGDVTGGVYKARERIHRRLADRRLLAIPASRRRVAACDPN